MVFETPMATNVMPSDPEPEFFIMESAAKLPGPLINAVNMRLTLLTSLEEASNWDAVFLMRVGMRIMKLISGGA